jgi:methionine-rich copper-binding protein CopC
VRFRSLLATAVAVALAAVLVTAGPAAAHDTLVSATPAADSTVAGTVDEVVLTLSEPPLSGLQTGIVISVTGPDGAEHTSGDVRTAENTIAKDVDLTAAGAYDVRWRSVSVDGHPIDGEYRFTSQGAPSATPTPTATSPSAAGAATPTATATADAVMSDAAGTAAPVEHQHGQAATLWFLVGLVVLVLLAVLVTRVVSRRRAAATGAGEGTD